MSLKEQQYLELSDILINPLIFSCPEAFKAGENFKATNKVFPINYRDGKAIYKKLTSFSSLANAYYTFCDKFFYANQFLYGTRKLSTKRSRFNREVFCLKKLDGQDAPGLIDYSIKHNALIREYLDGSTFRDYEKIDTDKVLRLEDAFDSLQRIHSKNIFIGDAHVKNIFIDDSNNISWLDFDGLFRDDLIENKAIDVLKFVYSTDILTRSYDVTCINALNVRNNLKDEETKRKIKDLVDKNPSPLRFWLPTRISSSAHKEIINILKF